MTLLSLFDELHEILGAGAVLTAIGCGLTLGSRPYRLAALVMIAEAFGWLAFSWLFDRYDRVIFSHVKSLVIAGLLAAIVFRHRSAGLIVLLGLQLAAVIIHLSIWLEQSIAASVNAIVLNGLGWLMIATLFIGSIGSLGHRALPENAAGL